MHNINNNFYRFFRNLPRFKGKALIGRMLLKSRQRKEEWIKANHGLRFHLPNLYETIAFDIFLDGAYEPEVSMYLGKKLPTNGAFIDVGVNIGSISLPLAKARPDCTVIGIEASAKVFKYFEDNVQANQVLNVIPLNKAVSSADGETVSFYSPDDKFGKGSMSAVFTTTAETVETITLDTLVQKMNVKHVDIIKVDVEGFETLVFKGGKSLLSPTTAPDIIFEFVDWAEDLAGFTKGEAQQLLLDYGYRLFNFDHLSKEILSPVTKGSLNLLATKRLPA